MWNCYRCWTGLFQDFTWPFHSGLPSSDDERHALVIGCNSYVHLPKLYCAINDAQAISSTLRGFHKRNVHECLDPTVFRAKNAIGALEDGLKSRSASVVFIFLACHGLQVSNDVLFQMSDSDPKNMKQDIRLSDLLQSIPKLVKPSCKIVFVLDCCRTESETAPRMEIWNSPNHFRREVFLGFACAPQRASREDRQAGRGVFTKHFVRYLATERYFEVAWQRTKDNVFAETRKQQDPWCTTNFSDLSTFRLIGVPFVSVPEKNKHFVGRREQLSRLHRSQQRQGVAVFCGVHGSGGVGKTQLCIQAVHEGYQSCFVKWWIPSHTEQSMMDTLHKLSVDLKLCSDATSVVDAARLLKDWLALHNDWVLVFDNLAVDLPDLPDPITGHVLITTRDPCKVPANSVTIAVPPFERDESIEFLKKATDITTDEAGAAEIAEMVGDFPLALAQVAAYIRDNRWIDFQIFAQRFHTRQASLLHLSGRLLAESKYGHTLATAWDMTKNLLAEKLPAAVRLMQMISLLDAENLEYRLLSLFDHGEMDDALRLLHGQCLLDRAVQGRFRVHRMWQLAVRCDLEASETCEEALESCLWTIIDHTMPVGLVHDGGDNGELELCGPHCLQLSKLLRSAPFADMHGLEEGRCRIFILASEYCRVNCLHCQFGVDLLKAELPRWQHSNPHTAALNLQLAKLMMMIATSQTEFPQCRRAAFECVERFTEAEKKSAFGVLAVVFSDMLTQWCYEGDKEKADAVAVEVQAIVDTVPGYLKGRAQYALGCWHERCGARYDEAAKLYKDGFHGKCLHSSKSAQRTALMFLSAIVRAYEKANSLDDALYWARQADLFIKKRLSDQDPVASYALSSLGIIYAKKDEWAAAVSAFEQAIRARRLSEMGTPGVPPTSTCNWARPCVSWISRRRRLNKSRRLTGCTGKPKVTQDALAGVQWSWASAI